MVYPMPVFIIGTYDENGVFNGISFKNEDKFNFGFDCVDAIAEKDPDKLAMLHLDKNKNERKFTFKDIKRASNQVANYFTSLGIKKGDKLTYGKFWE